MSNVIEVIFVIITYIIGFIMGWWSRSDNSEKKAKNDSGY